MATVLKNVCLSKFILQVLNSLKDANRALVHNRQTSIFSNKRVLSTSAGGQDVKSETNQRQEDPLPLFCSERVQSLLGRITGFDVTKINRVRPAASVPPEYHLLTEEQLKQKQELAEAEARDRLQMPPYMKAREPITEVLSRDKQIQGVNQHKYVFTDITYAMLDRERQVVVREPDGTLRRATWEERDKVNQIYNPQPGRKLFVPKMFSPENLEKLLAQRKYEYVLDRACVQFEPDNVEYIRVTHRTYEVVNSRHDFDELRSTRHFGPMAFYLVWHKNIDQLLVDMLKRDKLVDGADLVQLFHAVHPDCESAQESTGLTDSLQLIELYCQRDAVERGQVELALQAYYAELQTEKAA
ncbi:small ribosomal subunit protein mS22-like [Liolophura sinensis]|uniref:small ribosomal subunit protein mS22-like n=1 Tax=Liolophura sinensis TaxID=3198878 RepID=UPI00315804E4